jgi:hypothetical protein
MIPLEHSKHLAFVAVTSLKEASAMDCHYLVLHYKTHESVIFIDKKRNHSSPHSNLQICSEAVAVLTMQVGVSQISHGKNYGRQHR